MKQRIYEDIAAFLAHSITIELEASEQLRELASAMASQNHADLAKLFKNLAHQSEEQGALVEHLSARLSINNLRNWDYSLSNVNISNVTSTGDRDFISPLLALKTALSIEERAAFAYRDIAENSKVSEICRYANEFAEEELAHCNAVKQKIADLNHHRPDNDVIPLHSKRDG